MNLLTFCLCTWIILPSHQDGKNAAIQDELKRWQGTWTAEKIEHNGGSELPEGGLKWVVKHDRYEVWIGKQNLETIQINLDPTKQPRTLVMKTQGSQRVTGIYQLEGNSLKVCYDLTGKAYPIDFAAPKGVPRILYVFRKEM